MTRFALSPLEEDTTSLSESVGGGSAGSNFQDVKFWEIGKSKVTCDKIIGVEHLANPFFALNKEKGLEI